MDSSPAIRFRHRLTVRLTGWVIVVLLLIGVPFLLAFQRLVRGQQLDALAETTDGLSGVVIDSLSAAMLVGRPHLFDEVLVGLSKQPEVESVLLLDHRGRVIAATDPALQGRLLDRNQEVTCRVCHEKNGGPPTRRNTVARDEGGRVFRTMTVIGNDVQCHACHDPLAQTNGLLLMDLTLSGADRRFFANMGGMLALGALMVVLTIAVLILLLQKMVHGPLRAVVLTSRKIVQGDLNARIAVSTPGEFGQLAAQVNGMTDHLAGAIVAQQDQRRELQAILDAVDDEIVVLDRERRVVTVNEAYRKMFGEPDVELTGRPCQEVTAAHLPCTAEESDGCPVQRVFDTGRLSKAIVSWSGPDGRERVVEIHASPLRGPDGGIRQAVEVRRDISERRKMEAVLAHSEHLASLGLLASGLSHEINNPLGAIATSVAGLRRRLSTDPGIPVRAASQMETILARIGDQVERGRAITHRLLRIARPPGTGRGLIDVNHVVEEIVALLSHDIKRSNVRARLQLNSGLPVLRGDEARLGQLIMNLTLNAIQAMAESGGELQIATCADNGTIRIEIEDSGCGIPPQLLKRIYEPFFTTKPAGKGTGLGLFITHQLVTDMGGTVDVCSEPGRGTVFTVRLSVEGRPDEP